MIPPKNFLPLLTSDCSPDSEICHTSKPHPSLEHLNVPLNDDGSSLLGG